MAHISRPKNQHQNSHNHHPQLPSRGNRPGHTIPIPGVTKSVPGYPGFGPPLPGPDLEGVRNRSPDQGGFQLEFVCISRVINHMTCYKFECSHL